ncbi:MAG: sulfatase, partial [Bacteroidetes bacterium QS_1_65_9]
APNRSALVTGLYPTSYGAQHMRTSQRTAALDAVEDPELLAIPTYEAVPPPEARFATEYLRASGGYFATNDGKTDYQFETPATAYDRNHGGADWREQPEDSDAPFFSVINIHDSHESNVWKNADKPLQTDPADVRVPPYYPDTPTVREDIARNYDNIARMDTAVGNVMDRLRDDGLLDETIVFFFGDHGSGLPRMKRTVYDSGIQVPLIVRVPDAYRDEMGAGAPGTATDRLVSFIDFAPTLLSLAGVDVPDYMPGRPFLGAQQGRERAPERSYAFAARDRMDPARHTRRAVTDGRFKYIRNYRPDTTYYQFLPYRNRMALMQELLRYEEEGRLDSTQAFYFRDTMPKQELYDTRNDPHEVNNELRELRRAEQRWRARTDDMGLIPEPVLKNVLWPPRGEQPTVAAPTFDVRETEEEGAATTVRIESAARGTSIGYRMNASGPWQVYTGPVRVAPGDTLRAQAVRMGHEDSATARWTEDAE